MLSNNWTLGSSKSTRHNKFRKETLILDIQKRNARSRHSSTDKYPFGALFTGHFVDNEQIKVTVVRYSQFENTARMNHEEFTHKMSVSKDSCDHGNQSDRALTKGIHSFTGVTTKLRVCHVVISLNVSKLTRICHVSLLRTLQLQINRNRSSETNQNLTGI